MNDIKSLNESFF